MVEKRSSIGNAIVRHRCRLFCIVIILLFGTVRAVAQKVDAFARISLSKRSVYAQQPIKATITVYTATWFTQPLSFDNIQIPNAFIIPFTRTTPGVFQINGKQYAGLEFYYLIYPYKSGSYQLPVINITAETPPEGDYRGVRVKVKTQPLKYTVKEVPASFNGESWFVAKSASLSDHWSKSLSTVKVGDVVERTIQIRARGALPNFIPEIKPGTPEGVSTYQNDPQLIDQRNEYDVNGTRVEKVTYLFEKAGAITIPGVKLQWWNPIRQHVETRETKAVTVNVHPNENLGILATVRDSLNAQQAVPGQDKAKRPSLIFGMTWKKFSVFVLASLIVLWIVFKLIRRFSRWIRAKRGQYRASEKYWFHQFMRADSKPSEIIARFYAWWDRLPNQPPSLKESVTNNSLTNNEVLKDWLKIETTWINQEHTTKDSHVFKKQVATIRTQVSKTSLQVKQIDDHQTEWPD
jgi:hypothetical protein